MRMPELVQTVVILFVPCFAVGAQDVCSSPTERNVVKFYEYAGTQTPNTANVFSVFRKIVDDGLASINLSPDIQAMHRVITTEPKAGAANGFAKGQLTPQLIPQLMTSDPRLLQILDGLVQEMPNKAIYISSQIYVSRRPNQTSVMPISADFTLDPRNYDQARAVHLAAIYLSLAYDAEMRNCRTEASTFVARASELLHDVKSKSAGVSQLRLMVAERVTASAKSP